MGSCARSGSVPAWPPARGAGGVITIPFDPDEEWGARAEHRVGGTVNGSQVRGTITPGGPGWVLTVTPMWMRDASVTAGQDAIVELAPEGPQRDDLAGDVREALEASPAAAAHSTPWRSSTARPTSAGSTPPPAGQSCGRPRSRGGQAARRRDQATATTTAATRPKSLKTRADRWPAGVRIPVTRLVEVSHHADATARYIPGYLAIRAINPGP
jgi:hypothetical protein